MTCTRAVAHSAAMGVGDGKTPQDKGKHAVDARQVALVKNLVDGMTLTEAARRAGYSKKCPGQAGYQALQNLKLKMPELFDRLGLSDVALIEKHLKSLLSTRTTKFFQHGGACASVRSDRAAADLVALVPAHPCDASA